MEHGKDIIKFSKELIDNISNVDKIIDNALEPVKDYTDTIGDLAAPIKALISINNLRKKIALKAFIKNYAYELDNGYEINKKETIRLEKFFHDKKNIQFVAEVIDNAIYAKSVKSSAILGSIAGKILKDKTEVSFESLALINCLKIMSDIDLVNFISLFEYIQSAEKNNVETDEYRTRDFYSKNNVNPIKLDRLSLESTIEKLKRVDGLSYSEGGMGNVGNARGAFVISSVTNRLYAIIKATKIID